MVRGKYAQRAETRRDWEGIEAERDAALLRAHRAEEERSRVVANAEVSVAALRADVDKLRAHVAAGTSIEVERLRAQIEEQRQKLEKADSDIRTAHEVRLKTDRHLAGAIAATFDVTLREADDLVTSAVSGVAPKDWDAGDLVKGRHGVIKDSPHIRRAVSSVGRQLERARGIRRSSIDFSGVGCEPDAWIVHRGDHAPRVLVALYSNENDAKTHAAQDDDLRVESWYFRDRMAGDDES